MRGLLDADLLNGPQEVVTHPRPERLVRPVKNDDLSGLLVELEWLCQVWSGSGHPVIPVCDRRIPGAYAALLQTEQIDAVGGLQDLTLALPRRVEQRPPEDFPVILIAAGEPRGQWTRRVTVADLAADDPWRAIYAAVLGTLPKMPTPRLSELAFLSNDLEFDSIFPIERQQAVGSLDDLLRRLEDREQMHPRQLCTLQLAPGMMPGAGLHGFHNSATSDTDAHIA